MSELHQALTALGYTDFSDVPLDDLAPFLQHAFEAGELICNSVPPPAGGSDFDSSRPATSQPDSAASANDIIPSDARPTDPHPSHAGLRGSWGKPIKISAKDNTLGISVYKMAGNDRNGAWFARRSVHEGLSFSKFKRAMRWEFAESLAASNGPGDGAVRGIGGDQRLEHKTAEGVGDLDVYQLSAQFPGPTTPREFLTLLLTSSAALGEKTTNGDHVPRHYMVISKPTEHPDAPARNGYIRGHYESVEMIREIPLHKKSNKAASTTDLNKHMHADQTGGGRERASTVGFAESRGPSAKGERLDKHEEAPDSEDAELNPVEWIMITRSDPGGGIPRFMVDRGTPSGICNDAVKFFNWACAKDSIPDPHDEQAINTTAQEKSKEQPQEEPQTNGDSIVAPPISSQNGQAGHGGMLSHLTNTLEAGLDAYAPVSVANVAHQYLDPKDTANDEEDEDSSDDSSSWASADEYLHREHSLIGPPPMSNTSLPLSADSSVETESIAGLSHHEKEIRKIQRDKEKLDEKLAKKREAEDEKLKTQQEKESTDTTKAVDKHEKELKKQEEKHAKEVAKLEAKKQKELRKVEEKRKKQADRDIVGRVSRERDDFRGRLELVQRENELLREQIGEVQRENTALVHRLSKVAGGDVAVRALRDDLESARRNRSSSMGSTKSRTSLQGSK